jgi:branched-chain amino acid transport system ATP-binding protein
VLSLVNVSAGYGATTVLRNVNLTVPDGSVVALLGANGAGKTTTLRVACGLIAPSAGHVMVNGGDMTARPPHAMRTAGVCHVPEGRGIFRNLTVRENLDLQASVHGGASAIAAAVETYPVLGRRMNQMAGTLSGGEQQMLALSRAMIQEPNTILLDEVSMGLAPTVVELIFQSLRALAAKGTSLLLVEQYVSLALGMADYVYVLNRGRITFAGDPSELDRGAVFEQYVGVTG